MSLPVGGLRSAPCGRRDSKSPNFSLLCLRFKVKEAEMEYPQSSARDTQYGHGTSEQGG